MKKWILIGLMGVGLLTAQAQTNTEVVSPEVAAYDAQSIRLIGEGMGYVQGGVERDPSIFNRKMRGQLQGDSANLLINASVKNQRKGFWNGLGGLIITGAGLAAAANTPVGWVVVAGGAVWYGVGLHQLNKGTQQLHHAVWYHNREIVIRASRP
jgi:hypothetical protein